MGTAKYKEDDNEINEERMYYKDRKDRWETTYYPEGIDDAVEKLENLYEKNAKAKSGETTPSPRVNNINQNSNASAETDIIPKVKKPKEYADRILHCKACGKEFIFIKNDQIEYDRTGKCEPNRCAKCERRKYLPTWIKI